MIGVYFMLTKNNVKIGLEWRFGTNWPGVRCGARTRRGSACQRPAKKSNGKCRLHSGASTEPKTEVGRLRISEANLRHGKFTKDKLKLERERAAKEREIKKELRQLESNLITNGLLDPNWKSHYPS